MASTLPSRSQTLAPIVEYYSYPAYEIPAYCFNEHKIALHTKMPDSIQTERVLAEERRVSSAIEGEVIGIPANTPHQLCWDKIARFEEISIYSSSILD